jgi:pyruvate/2-oxoglutarate dehydrogenase complex dihydrolipoamide dehydrogenase (E3) component
MKFDAIIIGFGKGGKTLAAALAKQGQQVALVEKSSAMYGGTCINVGCIPSKSLVTSAAESARHGEESFERKAERYAAAIGEKRRVTSLLRGKNYHKLADLPNVRIVDGLGSFVSPTQVEVRLTAGGTETLEAEKLFINTGAVAMTETLPGMEGNPRVYGSETLMDEETLPRRLTLIGAGYIGMEFASLYAAFGSAVTVLQRGDVFLPREDRDVADAVRENLEAQGVRFLLGAKTLRVEGGNVIYQQGDEEGTVEGDAILLATGRKPNTEGLGCEKAGVALTSRGAVQVDDHLRTTAPNIWAMGDVTGGAQFTFTSLDDYRIVLSDLTGGERALSKRKNVPNSVFMATPLARVGLTEAEALEQGLPIRVLKLPTAAVPKAQVLGQTRGFLKAVVHGETGLILGAALLCPESYEVINLIKLAMDYGIPAAALRDQVYTHPTMTEALNDLFAL